MAKTRYAIGETAAHTFEIMDLNGATWSSFEFHVYDWEINYQANDAYQPGIIPSTLTLEILIGDRDSVTGPLYDLMTDSTGRFVIQVYKTGVVDLWRGWIQPELCSVELINGQRVIRLEASDGFAFLDATTNRLDSGGIATGLVPITSQLAEILRFGNYFDLFRNFVIAACKRGYYVGSNTDEQPAGGESLYYAACIYENWMYELNSGQRNFRNIREVLDDICTSFGLQCFQVQGYIAFRPIYDDNPLTWYEYDLAGDHSAYPLVLGGTTSIVPQNGGLEMAKAAVREWWVNHTINAPTLINQGDVPSTRTAEFIGTVIPTGSNNLKYWLDAIFDVILPANYGSHTVGFRVTYRWQFNGYYWNGTAWTTTPSNATHNFTEALDNPDPAPLETQVQHTVANNKSMTNLPNIGPNDVYLTVSITRTSGPALTIVNSNCTYKLEYASSLGQYLVYLIDNNSKAIGEYRESTTRLGDKYVANPTTPTATANELRIYLDTARASQIGNATWGDNRQPLIYAVYYDLVSKLAKPRQYYELDTVTQYYDYSKRMNFGGEYYRPINLTIREDESSATLIKIETDTPTP